MKKLSVTSPASHEPPARSPGSTQTHCFATKSSFKALTLGAALAASLALAHTVQAGPMFIEESPNHFIWESGPIGVNGSQELTGTYWYVFADFVPVASADSYVTVENVPLTGQAKLESGDGISGDGNYSIDFDDFHFYSLTAKYEGAILNTGIQNVRVEGWLTAPSTSVPDTGSTLALLGLSLAGLPFLRRWLK